MTITSEQYSVSTITEVQKIALDFKENLENVLKDYKDEPIKQGELLYALLMQAANAWKFISDNLLKPISKETISNYLIYLKNIYKGIEYLESNVDSRLIRGSSYVENDVEDVAKELFCI